ncbi:carboxypeptidase regulatory-like domain-containing protein [Streptomyces roseirectus]|uniref:Carboxypeptidase regulatory-like domain-containing protein n=1 Tax=Streptomyces roseirectus TaxID=2768066 RepID=A0A7H0IPB1_9ACTN|nr:SdrD B-like domain-containing protein [Streptomyces roseirectus]QNP74627.1 carboxypeptidase regulatory-like domain-containing protein [Streptomyces roseirectus]
MRKETLRRRVRRRIAVGLVLAVCAAGAPVAQAASAAPGQKRVKGAGDGTVTVRVVTDVDADGAYDSVLEPGMAGVTVTLTDDAGQTITATTDADGVASFTPASSALTGGKYRIEVKNPDTTTYQPAVAGLGTGAGVMRSNTGFVDVSGGTDVSYTTGFLEPDVYYPENPTLVTAGLAKGDATGMQGLLQFDGNLTNTSPGGTVNQLTDNTAQQAVFGIGTDRSGNVFMGTSVKRHTEYGPAGPVNAIYRYNSTSKAVTTFTTLPGALTAHDATNSYLHDDAIYDKVGREGLGDVDVSGDGKTLYAVNLNDSKLYSVPVNGTGDGVSAGAPVSYDIPKPAACVGDWHPYGIGVRGKRVLVGGVCGAESTVSATSAWGDPSQLSAHVYEFKGGAFSELFTSKLDFDRGCAYRFLGASGYRCDDTTTVGQQMSADWEAWNERVPVREEHTFVSAPQPMLSNLEIADNGDLIMGFRDRFADMQGNQTYSFGSTTTQVSAVAAGDVLRACLSGTTYTLESNATCGSFTGANPNNQQGPGNGEFYNDTTTLSDANHDQITEGGTALQPYRKKLWTTAFDPWTNQAYEQGIREWVADGSVPTARKKADDSGSIIGNLLIKSTWSDGANLFGKGNGLADLELISAPPPVQIGNRTWYDADGDGIQDPSEAPLPGVVVTLKAPDGTTLTATTDANGEYYIGTAEGLKPNTTYDVTFDYSGADTSGLPGTPTPADLQFTKANAGSDDHINSKPDSAGKTTVAVGDPGYVNHDVDAGVTPLNKLGDYVWYDANGDGIQDPTEQPAPGITVTLIDPATGNTIRTTTTGTDGKYLFDKLPDGSYKVCFSKPDGYQWTKKDAGASGDDSVVDPATGCSPEVTLGPANRSDLTLDAGLTPLNKLGDYVWYDENGNGIQDPDEKPAPGIPVKLIDTTTGQTVKTTTTGTDGKYLFDNLPDGSYKVCFTAPDDYRFTKQNAGASGDDSVVDPATGCSDPVVLGPANRADLTQDAGLTPLNKLGDYVWYDENGNGIQDPGEKPASGIPVKLVDPATGKTLKTTTTDADGKYLFDKLPDGSYKVCFTAPAGYQFTKQNAGASGNDSVADRKTGCSAPVTLGPGNRADLTLDAGLTPLNKLGDYVWYDDNANGIQDRGEKPASGVTVKLVDPATGKTLRTTKTNAQGKYLFDNLPDGKYKVCFVKPNGYQWTKKNAGAVGNDSVVDVKSGCSDVVTLGPGKRADLTLDAGLVKELKLTVQTVDAKTGSPLGNVVVQLWRDAGGKKTLVGDCSTPGTGKCAFGKLPPGTYYAVVKDVPEGYDMPKNPTTKTYRLTVKNDGLVIRIPITRGEPCKGKC